MQFRIKLDDFQPSERRYYKVMDPLWKQFRKELDEYLQLDWKMRETRGPLNMIAEAELDDERVDWVEIRGECAREVEPGQGDEGVLVELEEWYGLVILSKSFAAEGSDDKGMLRTEREKTIGGAIKALRNICDEKLDLQLGD